MQGKVEPSWWAIMQDEKELIGILVVYVDDLLICGMDRTIEAVANAIKTIWKTSDLQMVSEGAIRIFRDRSRSMFPRVCPEPEIIYRGAGKTTQYPFSQEGPYPCLQGLCQLHCG